MSRVSGRSDERIVFLRVVVEVFGVYGSVVRYVGVGSGVVRVVFFIVFY